MLSIVFLHFTTYTPPPYHLRVRTTVHVEGAYELPHSTVRLNTVVLPLCLYVCELGCVQALHAGPCATLL